MALNILVIHALDSDPSCARKTVVDNARCFERYAPENRFYYHDVADPVSGALQDIRFHAVIMDTSAASFRVRRPRHKFLFDKARYSFIAKWDAVKIAFPQDEYDHSELLDDWLADYGFDLVYSVVWEHRDLLYPRMSACGTILPTLTAFVNDADIGDFSALVKPLHERSIDIGYRARFLPAQYGSYGQIKGLMAGRVLQAVNGDDLATDISTDPEDVLLGDDWLRFMSDCRYCLGSQGGVSLWDPRGELRDRVEAFLRQQPAASFEEIEAACFPGQDRRWIFSAVSPRLFEAAMMKCGQILIEAPYLEGLEPWRHYLPLDENCESMPEILGRMRHRGDMQRMIDGCYQELIETPRFRYRTHVAAVMHRIADLVARKRIQGSSKEEFERLVARHREILPVARRNARGRVARLGRSAMKLRWKIQSALAYKSLR